ncbi:hypothetical protein [Chryseobacterium sp. NKUCC03_KSP]|uniref:hypothetical protein n=1 Tax=Chryseobacterium sp. NKUCC03_KSP TaxID=2842125 RepID=UPI001C5A89A6|nr:hypothetical protein [Chryseobacterium sp. NKUCC03_KSP]MBW3521160.1 hypothetical protein [Chryseobacterium sp. NKUCC03_KSP]
MRNILIVILTFMLLINCNRSEKQTVGKNERVELVPEPDKTERSKYEAIEKLKNSNCIFSEPDTSLSGIILRNSESATKIVGSENSIDKLDNYRFYSTLKNEILTLTQHPGDSKNQISIIKVERSDRKNDGFKELNFDTFKTEKGIKLGLTKKQIIEKLGNCYAPIDSTKGYIELYYVIEQPKDSKSKILENNKMPVYFASYKLWNDRLEKFEFGFEYP